MLKISYVFTALAFWPVIPAMAVVNCEEIRLEGLYPKIEKVTDSLYPSEQNLYKFTFNFSMECGFRASQVYFPKQAVVEKLVNTFYLNQIKGPINDEIKGLFREFNFYTRNSLYNDAVAYEAKHLSRYEIKHIQIDNRMEFSAPILKSNGFFAGLKNISWSDSCTQESAGWCYAWQGVFNVTWAWNGTDFEAFENKVKKDLAPALFKETYQKYALFVATEALK